MQLGQRHKITPVQGQFANLSTLDHRADVSGGGLHLNVARFDCHDLTGRAQRKLGVYLGGCRDVYFHILGNDLFEARRLYLQLISAHIDRCKRIGSRRGRRGRQSFVVTDIAERNRSARNCRPRRISHRTADGSRIVLSLSRLRREQ